MDTRIAQTTQNPDHGASRAEDFQPQTRNPQQAPANLQPNSGLDQGGVQEILSGNSDARILVPGASDSGPKTQGATTVNQAGINNGLIWAGVLLLVISAAVAILWFRRKAYERISKPR